METRFQHFLLARKFGTALAAAALLCFANYGHCGKAPDIDTEFFELGATVGILNVQDFTSEMSLGFSTTFKTTEDFFLQFNYLQADISLSSVEESAQGAFSGDRNYQHFNLLLGYNLFQGEVFRGNNSGLSAFYVVAGVGDTEFLDESNFTYVYGVGYQMALSRRYTLRLDYRNYIYDSIVVDQIENTTTNSHIGVGLAWLF